MDNEKQTARKRIRKKIKIEGMIQKRAQIDRGNVLGLSQEDTVLLKKKSEQCCADELVVLAAKIVSP